MARPYFDNVSIPGLNCTYDQFSVYPGDLVAAALSDRADGVMNMASTENTGPVVLTRNQARRLREVYRSAGWPSQDGLEIELLAAGMLERKQDAGHDRIRLTDAGVAVLAQALQRNQRALSAHDGLVARVAQMLLRDGRLVWTGLALRARLPSAPAAEPAELVPAPTPETDTFDLLAPAPGAAGPRWKMCKPDVFSIRNTSVAAYLEPVVHEIKVSRADLLGDLRVVDKRDSYLDLGGQCWYVLGCDSKGRPIAHEHEVPATCGVIFAGADGRLDVVRHAPRRAVADLPFSLWMALAKTTPLPALMAGLDVNAPSQAHLSEQQTPGPCL